MRIGQTSSPDTPDTKYKVWTDFSIPASEEDCNCRVREAEGRLTVEVMSDLSKGDLLLVDRGVPAELLTDLRLDEYPIDLSSPLFFGHQKQKTSSISCSTIFLR